MTIQTLDVISVNIWSILASLANLLIVFLIVKKFLFKPVRNILAKRQAAVDKVYTDADEELARASAERIAYAEKLSKADEEAAGIIRSANERAAAIGEDIIGDANRKAQAALQKADLDIAFEKKRAMNEIKDEISGISVSIAEKLLEREIREEDHRDLIDRFIDGISGEEQS